MIGGKFDEMIYHLNYEFGVMQLEIAKLFKGNGSGYSKHKEYDKIFPFKVNSKSETAKIQKFLC